MNTNSYRADLLKRLSSKRHALEVLQHSFDESCRDGNWKAFGLALKLTLEARGLDKQAFAKTSKISRHHLYRLFDGDANPTLKTLLPVLSALGLRLNLQSEVKKDAA